MPIWAFDVDGCVIDSLSGISLRPHTHELLDALLAQGHTLVLWSAGGAGYAKDRAIEHGVEHYFSAFHSKEVRDANGRYIPPFATDASTVFVDDRPEDMPIDADIRAVFPYLSANPHDRALANLRRAIG